MRVMTMDGGFRGLHGARGLGLVTTATTTASLARFNTALGPFDVVRVRLEQARVAGQIPRQESQMLFDAGTALAERAAAHESAMDALETDAQLTAWIAEGEAIIRDAARWTQQTRIILGDEESKRGLRLALLATASIVVIGGTTWALWNRRSARR